MTMPNIDVSLDEQYSDLRSSEVAYRLTVLNRTSSEIEIVGITPRTPDSANVIDVRNPAHVALKARHQVVAAELTELLKSQIHVYDEEYRKKREELFSEYLSSLRGRVLRTSILIWMSLLMNQDDLYRSEANELRRRRDALVPSIESHMEAEQALGDFFQADDYVARAFRLKTERLKQLEFEMKAENSYELAALEPESYFAQTYIIQFPRKALNPRKFNISVDVQIRTPDGKEHVQGTTASIVISPRPYILSVIAVAASLLGTLLSLAKVDGSGTYLPRFVGAWVNGTFLASTILGLVIFNVYEYVGFRNSFSAPVSWRSALLIGILCGLFQARFLEALGALLPVSSTVGN